ncbi:MAG: ribose-5-phosphate isomerase RpiA [Pseudomonadota bacterium]
MRPPADSGSPGHGDGARAAKRAAAAHALEAVEPGMKLGLGSGSTAAEFVSLLGERVRAGLKVIGVPTSIATGKLAEKARIPLTTLDAAGWLDLTVDGADEIDPHLRLIKGGGGALLIEKIVAFASDRMIVIADARKRVETLGAFPLPIEITPFGWETTRAVVEKLLEDHPCARREAKLRIAGDAPFITDEGNMILDLQLERIEDPDRLAAALNDIPGVVENGLFIGLAEQAIIAEEDGTATILKRGA